MSKDLQALINSLREFSSQRDWDQFHSPKNLASALTVEAAELLEHFQWLTEAQSRELPADKRVAVGEEMADVLLYLLRLSDQLNIDLVEAAKRKLTLNAAKYPVDRSRGTSKKYTEL
ncbi:MAG: nucleotide pyrophosphohydrolase [Polaromonas sp.]|uniref:nucleotide pyrophosphohydrolase n=1 Tax=Polaromonas sp. TaxID=1869339 RepID=UPI002737772D|nr:nucleotide pyrophosphohydrolase [Polaromonas sp.]MDP3797091.1 nucleotide pyrophosphohydrolase [Polaromonas sp.]